jgi:DNA-binding Lrp family transcriptional regulator
MSEPIALDDLDRRIINQLQRGFPLCARPYAEAAEQLGCDEAELLARLQALLNSGLLSRFGPLYNAEKLGGALSLCAIAVPEARFDDVTELVNAHAEVAHNYRREHRLNMWFVLATDSLAAQRSTLDAIEAETGLVVHNMPKQAEFFVGLHFEV